jgi:predicted nucleic acid-binding Zn ribbon protein
VQVASSGGARHARLAPCPIVRPWWPPLNPSAESVCGVCGGPRDARKREACSDKCRAAISRRRRADAQGKRDAETLAVLDGIMRLCSLLRKRFRTTLTGLLRLR